MKQLLSISKQRKHSKSQTIKQIFNKQPSDQQDNFIYQQAQSDNSPTQHQIQTYASILGIKLPEQADLLYIARQCLNQPMPNQWSCEQDQRGQIFYVNNQTGEISMEHPCDERFRQKVIAQRKKKIHGLKKNMPKINMSKSKTNFIENVFKAKYQNDQLLYEEQTQQNMQLQNKKLQGLRKGQNIADLISENINVRKKNFEQDNNDSQPINPIKVHYKKQTKPTTQLQKLNLKHKAIQEKNKQSLPPKQRREGKQKKQAKQQIKLNPSKSSKKVNSQLYQRKCKQIQQRIQRKYELKNQQLQKNYIQKLKQMNNKQNQFKMANIQNIDQFINSTVINQYRKQLQTKLMLKHTIQLDKKRAQAERLHRNNLLTLNSEYQIQHLFSQMAECRKFMSRQKTQKQKSNYLVQMEQNLNIANKIQVAKVVSDLQKQCNTVMHEIVSQLIKKGDFKDLDWQRQQKIREEFINMVDKIVRKYTDIQESSYKQIQENSRIKQQALKQKQYAIKNENNSLYSELQSLKRKLKQLQQDNNTQRSNLSDKQSKLFQLLQNRVSAHTSRSSDTQR